MTRSSKLSPLSALRAAILPLIVVGAIAGPAAAQGTVVIERTSSQTAPGHFTPAVTVTRDGPPQVVRLGEMGLSRANYWDDTALTAWAGATFNAKAVIYTIPDIPEYFD